MNIINYIIEQAERYDIRNLQFEQDILYQLDILTDKWISNVQNEVLTNINSVLELSQTMIRIQNRTNTYLLKCKQVLFDKFQEYYDTADKQADDLINLNIELSAKQDISEISGNKEYDKETIQYIQDHAFELLTGHTQKKVEEIRSAIGDLFLRGQANKVNVRNKVEKILDTNKSKAEEIAQTELSRAYNYGLLNRMNKYKNDTGGFIKKYWHGFKYSERTCDYCRARIGNIYDIDDDSESLPAHPRCRCVWLPIMDGWDKPVDTKLLTRANMLNTGYSLDMMIQRINNRFGINYASFLKETELRDIIEGNRSSKVNDAMIKARQDYIKDQISKWDIAKDISKVHMSDEYNKQMDFWKNYVAGLMADNDKSGLYNAIEGIKGIMILPWNSNQLSEFNELINIIQRFN